jgi:gingipain R
MYGQDEMVNILTEWHGGDQYNHTLAGASLNGNMDVIDKGNHVATHDSWILFGDPSLMVRTDNPVEMEVSANPSVLMLGMSELVVNADTEYGIATLSMNGEVIASARVIDGTATLTFPGLSDVGNATLTVIGYNKVTYRGEVEIVPAEGPYLVLDNYEVATNNGSVLYGEESTVNIGVKNVGVEAVSNVNVTVTT